MPEPLSSSDFRSARWKLLPEDFIVYRNDVSWKRALIDEETWRSLTLLSDDVSIQTSERYGPLLQEANALSGEWLELTFDALGLGESSPPPLGWAVRHSYPELEASIFNALVGYYRTGISAMRNTIEHLIVALDCQLCDRTAEFTEWLEGADDEAFKFGSSANRVMNHASVKVFDARIFMRTGDNVFRRKDSSRKDPGGFARRLFCELSKYTHGAPGRSEADLWQSNGPIFHPDAFLTWGRLFCKVVAIGSLVIVLGHTEQSPYASRAKKLFQRASSNIPIIDDSRPLLEAIAEDEIWK